MRKRLLRLLRSRRGESLIEVLAAMVIVTILLGTLHAAVNFAGNSLIWTAEAQKRIADIQKNLAETAAMDGGASEEYSFQQDGGPGRFTLELRKKEKTVAYGEEGGEIIFYLFGDPEEGGA